MNKIGRFLWMGFLIGSLILSYRNLLTCDDGWIILLYLFFSIFSFLLSIICEFFIMNESVKVRQTVFLFNYNLYRYCVILGPYNRFICSKRTSYISLISCGFNNFAVSVCYIRVSLPLLFQLF